MYVYIHIYFYIYQFNKYHIYILIFKQVVALCHSILPPCPYQRIMHCPHRRRVAAAATTPALLGTQGRRCYAISGYL